MASKTKKTGVGKKVKKTPVKRTPKLKEKLAKESKVVRLDNLAWKPVEIPDNLGDYEGFYGLEEIDGVDFEIVDGKPRFTVKDDLKIAKKEKKVKKAEPEAEEEEEVEDGEGDDDDEEFTGFDDKNDIKVDDEEDKDDGNVDEIPTVSQLDSDKLLSNTFLNLDLPLPDDDQIDLPQWEDDSYSLSPYTLSGLKALGFTSPTLIQKKAIPVALQEKDLVGKATTGSGKTLAFGIPILEKYLTNLNTIKENNKESIINQPTGIIFTPTRELAHQVVDHLNKLAKYSPLSTLGIVSITGGLSIQKQERLLARGPGILVATPGRFLEIIEKDMEVCKRLAATDILVLDEADRLLQDGHFDEFERILDLFKKHRPKQKNKPWKWQTMVFSATFSKELFGKLDKKNKGNKNGNSNGSSLYDNEEILKLLNDKLKFKDTKPTLVDANPKEIVSGKVTEALVECGATERDLYLYYFLLMYPGSTLVFANSIDSVKRLVPFLRNLNIPCFSIHSNMIQKQRLRALEQFTAATSKNETVVLVASDVAARGLDIPNIDHVAHYHLPKSADIYIHRSGRTARAGNEGVSVMFCSPQEASGPLRKLRKLVASSAGAGTAAKMDLHGDVKLLPVEMDLVGQLRERASLSAKLADSQISTSSTSKEDSWMKQAAEDLGIEDLSDIDSYADDIIKKQRKRKETKLLSKDETRVLRATLRDILSQPIRKNSRRSYLTSGLQNLAHEIVSGKTHKEVLGHSQVNALQDLKSSKGIRSTDKKIVKSGDLLKQKKKADKQARKDSKKDKKEQMRNKSFKGEEDEE